MGGNELPSLDCFFPLYVDLSGILGASPTHSHTLQWGQHCWLPVCPQFQDAPIAGAILKRVVM